MHAFQTAQFDEEESQPLNKGTRARNDGGLLSQGQSKAKTLLHRLKVYWPQVTIVILLLTCLGLTISLFRCATSLDAPPHPGPKRPPHFADPATVASFLVVGDWGRRGDYNQSSVAAAMAAVAQRHLSQFVISTGDNFYPHGLNSTEDAEFELSFRSVYNHSTLEVPWYAVLGNHDYGDGSISDEEDEACLAMDGGCPRSPIYQLDAHLFQRDRRWNCARLYTLAIADGAAELFFMDTTPFVQKYQARPWAKYRGGVLSQSWESHLKELETRLARSSARWKILIAHHPVRSNGEHGDTKEMLQYVAPLMQAYNVRVAFHGHDHDLEHLHVPQQLMHYFVSGAGSKCRTMTGNSDSLFQHAASGFMSVNLRLDDMVVEAYGMDPSTPLYTTTIPLAMTPDGF